MLRAITHEVSPRIVECEITFVDREPIDLAVARKQHNQYCERLERLGVEVTRLTANLEHPDSCFVEDTAIVVDEVAVICSMGVPSRRGETRLIEHELSKYREIARVSLPATIEGGDVLRIGRKIYVGESSRTNAEGINAVSAILQPFGYSVIPVRTKGSLHLKSACTALDDETLFLNPEWIDAEPFSEFQKIYTPADEPWSANVLRVNDAVCVQAGFPRSVELISNKVARVEVIDISELRKAEAGLTCSSIIFEIDEPRRD